MLKSMGSQRVGHDWTEIICAIIILNSFSGMLPMSTSFSCFSGVLSCSFIWEIILLGGAGTGEKTGSCPGGQGHAQ